MRGVKVLLVEDEPMIRLIMSEILEEEGCVVTDAADGDTALRLIDRSDGFDLLLTDIQMPGRADGIAVGRRFRERHPGRPVVYTTGRPDSLRLLGELGPGESFLRKPYGPVDMLELLNRLLGSDGPALPPTSPRTPG